MSWVDENEKWKVKYEGKIIMSFRTKMSAKDYISENNKNYFYELELEKED